MGRYGKKRKIVIKTELLGEYEDGEGKTFVK